MERGEPGEVKAWTRFRTALRWLEVRANEEGIVGVAFGFGSEEREEGSGQALSWVRQARSELEAYFSGNRRVFSVPLVLAGSAFQQAVWYRLLEIPYGQTTTYGALACELGKPRAARAVGAACGSNPIPIFVPCHRVVGSGGALTGFAGGLDVKARLLALERQYR